MFAPKSNIRVNPLILGKTVEIAGRSMPGNSGINALESTTSAAVLPALTQASASPKNSWIQSLSASPGH